jgi:hypothetical protein
MNNIAKRKCCRCKVNKPENMFSKKKSGDYKKTCDRCLTVRKAYENKNKCEHGRYMHRCADCEYTLVAPELVNMMDAYL